MSNKADETVCLSVVIPCKNEEQNIARCLESVLKGTGRISAVEIIVVDSFSSDRSVIIAQSYPITVLQLRPQWPQSPAAGRYIGCRYACGKYILIIDADMELEARFLDTAIAFMEVHSQVAGVAGMGAEVYADGGERPDMYVRKRCLQRVDFLGGAALYRREALARCGNFNPYLRAEEEAELAQRLKRVGYTLYSLPDDMVRHYTSRDFSNFSRRSRAGMFRGIGQMLRLTMEQGTWSLNFLVRFRLFAIFAAVLTMMTVVLGYAIMQKKGEGVALVGIILLAVAAVACLRKKSIYRGMESLYKWVRLNLEIGRGFFEHTPAAESYPDDVLVIQRGTLR